MDVERSYYFDHWLHISKKIALPSDFLHIFHDFRRVHSPWTGADNPLGPNVLCKFLQPLTLYTSFYNLINVYSRRSGADNPQGTKF